MKTSTHSYKGFIITGFNLRQLGDREVSGMSYNVYATQDGPSLSATECLTQLSQAKAFIDDELCAGDDY